MPPIQDVDLPEEQLAELASELIEKFKLAQTARATQIDEKAVRWEKNYDGIPAQATRTVPFNRASNFMPQLSRMHADILGARLLGFLFATKPFWIIRTLLKDDIAHEQLEALGEGLNYIWDVEQNGFETADAIINRSLQTGTLILKGIWSDETRSYLRGDAFEEQRISELEYDPVPFEDFWPFPITARNTARSEILFHRIRLTQRSIDDRKRDGRWRPDSADLLMRDSSISPVEDARAQSSGIILTKDVDYPFSVIECWLDYDIGGKRKPIVVVLNPQVMGDKAILRAYYNFMPYGEKPFVDFVPMPRKGSMFGYSVPEVLEQDQEEAAQIHNFRRDANVIANTPTWKKKRYADVPNPATDWYPGAIIELDEMDDLEMLSSQINYNSMIDEEQFVMSNAERKIGISPSMQGFGQGQAAGKRGIYATGATLALLSEGNRRFDIYLMRLRYPFHRIGRLTVQSYNQFAPSYFDKFGEKGAAIKQAFGLVDREGKLLFDPSAATASTNREVDRQNLLQMAGILAQYYTQIIQLTQMVATIGPNNPISAVVLQVLDSAKDLANRILFAFDQGDRRRLVPDIRQLLESQSGGGGAAQPGPVPQAAGTLQRSQVEDVLRGIAAASAQAGGAGF